MKSDNDYVKQAMQLLRDHANEDYSFAAGRNDELTALAVGIAFVSDKFGPLTPVTKE